MKKSERLNQELIFLKGKKSFNISDLMSEFEISKRTALRDVQDLESMGVPLYVTSGRNGKYHILESEFTVPVYFNENEIAAVLFAIKALEKLISTPFDKSYVQIYDKMLSSISGEKSKIIEDYILNVEYKSMPSVAQAKYLNELMQAVKSQSLVEVEYSQNEYEELALYVHDLFFQDGVWFFNGYDVKRQNWRVYRCDCLKSCFLNLSLESPFKTREDAKKSILNYKEIHEDLSFKCKLNSFGREQFLKSNYFDMELEKISENEYILRGRTEMKHMDYLVNYFMRFGKNMEIISPQIVIERYRKLIGEILAKYS